MGEESNVKILINVTRSQQIDVEEICCRIGMDISDYFMKLHEERKQKENNANDCIENLKEEPKKRGRKKKQ